MSEVKLLTRSGAYVTTVSMPPFQIQPEVITWGARIFVLVAGDYREGMSWHCADTPRVGSTRAAIARLGVTKSHNLP